jgi:hypothetical protein
VFARLNKIYRSLTGRMTARQMEERVLRLLDVWSMWSILSPVFLYGLEAVFRMTESDVTRMCATDSNSLSAEELDWDRLQRRARIAGVSEVMFTGSSSEGRNGEESTSTVMTPAQLYNTLQYVNDFVKRKTITEEAAYVPEIENSEDNSYRLADTRPDDQPASTSRGYDDVDGVPVDDVDGIPLDDIDGVPIDDIDGVPMDDIDGVPIGDLGASVKSAPSMSVANVGDKLESNDDIDGVEWSGDS